MDGMQPNSRMQPTRKRAADPGRWAPNEGQLGC
jgi:hypothetical protein